VIAPGARVPTLVHAAQQRDRLEVLAPAEAVRHPLAGLARVVAVQHRGDGIHAQAIDAEALEPVQRAADEEVAHLVRPKL
jgi:hypothetical protein